MTLSSAPVVRPPQLALITTAEAKATIQALPQGERDAAAAFLRERIDSILKSAPALEPPRQPAFGGARRCAPAEHALAAPLSFLSGQAIPLPSPEGPDEQPPPERAGLPLPPDFDKDRLPDAFEAAIAAAFMPYYRVSKGDPDHFALFRAQPTLEVETTFPATPPILHHRVTHVGASGGYALLQLDYLTIWDHDSDLVVSDACIAMAGMLGIGLDALRGHAFDVERSAALVAAPLVNGRASTSVGDYRAHDYFFAAHEGVWIFDHSAYWTPDEPLPPGLHPQVALSLKKHATYPFNPDGMPLFHPIVIDRVFQAIQMAWESGAISQGWYLYLLWMAEAVFFVCVVEHFTDQGGAWAERRYNVGELWRPSRPWIADERVRCKLTPLLWRLE